MNTLISICGTTGIGKTALAIALAKKFNTEIVSCDSRQFFKGMEIGTAAPTPFELQQAVHHFIGHKSVTDYYSIGQFEKEALEKIQEIFANTKTAVMVGGSMMYEKAVIKGIHDLPEASGENQKKLQEIWENRGLGALQEMLRGADPEYFAAVHLENPRRLLRALDVIWQTRKKYSELISAKLPDRDFKVIRIGIEAPREKIYHRINDRVDEMMEAGLLHEVEKLKPFRDYTALKTVGYTELFKYLDDDWTLDFAVEEIKKNSRRFAKRQLTWYRNEDDIRWVNFENALEESLYLLKNTREDLQL